MKTKVNSSNDSAQTLKNTHQVIIDLLHSGPILINEAIVELTIEKVCGIMELGLISDWGIK